MTKYDAVLWDLDGTISASGEGVRECIRLMMTHFDKPCPDLSDFSVFIGPPLTQTFRRLCGLTEEEVSRALPIYRDYYDIHGTKANRLYDGVLDVLRDLHDRGVKMAICTSKNERLARDVIDLLGIGEYLDAICGSRDDGTRKEKVDLIPYALESLGNVPRERAVLIGDTCFDTRGAVATGVDFIGVTYGYGRRDLMEEAGATIFAATPEELTPYLF